MTLNDDQKTYIIAGSAAAVSLIAWLSLVVVPAWSPTRACATGCSRRC